MTSLFQRIGSKFGNAVDAFMSKSGFAVDLSTELQKIEETIVSSTTEAFTVGKKKFSAKDDKKGKRPPPPPSPPMGAGNKPKPASPKKEKFGSCDDPQSVMEGVECARKQQFSAVDDSAATAATTEDEKQKMKELEAKTQEYIKKDTSLSWNGGEANRLRHVRWANQVVEPSTSSGPISYKDAILAQPMPVLSPLRGMNQPQGIRAIADANAGISTQYYDPKLALAAAIPANISSAGLDYTQKATIAGKDESNTAATAGASSTFMAKFM
jgi:hypothetical protein